MINTQGLNELFNSATDEQARTAFARFMSSHSSTVFLRRVDPLRLQKMMVAVMGGTKVVQAYLNQVVVQDSLDTGEFEVIGPRALQADVDTAVDLVLACDAKMDHVESFFAVALLHLNERWYDCGFAETIEVGEGGYGINSHGIRFLSYGSPRSKRNEIIEFLKDLSYQFDYVRSLFDFDHITFDNGHEDCEQICVPWHYGLEHAADLKEAADRLDDRAFWSY